MKITISFDKNEIDDANHIMQKICRKDRPETQLEKAIDKLPIPEPKTSRWVEE